VPDEAARDGPGRAAEERDEAGHGREPNDAGGHDGPFRFSIDDGYRPPPGPPRRGPLVAAACIVVIGVIAVIVVVVTSHPTAQQQAHRGRTPGSTRPFALPPIASGSIRPTMVAPSRLPGDLHLDAGAADRSGHGDDVSPVIVWSAARRQALEVVAQPGCRDRSHALADRAVAAAQARRDPSADIRWCENGLEIKVVAGPSTDGAVAGQVVDSIRFTGGEDGRAVMGSSVSAPSGFDVIYGPPRGERVLLRYTSGRSNTKVVVSVRGSDQWSLDRYTARSYLDVGSRGRRTQLGPWPAFVLEPPSATGIVVQYDDHTLVSITGEGVSANEVRSLAVSLVAADPALAPTVTPDVFRRLANQT
jgi:hypothetical protein